jgi:Recombination endonuclease VII
LTPAQRVAKWRRDNPEKAKATRKQNYYANQEREKSSRRDSGFRRLYGITVAERDALITEQDGVCASCEGTFFSVPHIDHDHRTKKVRGILCAGCNQALGNVGESIPRLRALIRYLEKHNVVSQ